MRLVRFSVTVVVAFLAGACGTSSTTVTNPSVDRCAVTVTNSMPSVGAAGGSGRLTVTAGRECTWSITSNVSWITPRPPAGGQGDGSVDYVVAANPTADVRRGTVATGGQTLEVVQAGLACQFQLQPNTQDFDADGGTGSFAVEGPIGCNWTPAASDDWITITDRGSRTANGSVNFRVGAHTGARREGSISVGAQLFEIRQAASACRFQLSGTNRSFGGGGGTGTVTVTVTGPPSCNWTASADVPWISVTSATSGTGSGTIRFAVQANPGVARSGVLTIGGQKYAIAQLQAECNYSIDPGTFSFPASGGQTTVAVSTNSPCTWTTSDVPPWVNGVPASGTGPQAITITVGPNPGPARSAGLVIGGQSFALSQAAGCSYFVAPTSYKASGSGGTSSVALNTSAGCEWTSSGVPSWIIGIPALGTSSTLIQFTVEANSSSLARSVILTIGGRPFTVAQAGVACTYSLSSTSYSASASRESSKLSVNSPGDCPWTSSGVPSWVTGIPTSGTGPTTFTFTVAANPSRASRNAKITIAGRNFTITQAGAP